MLKVEKLSYKQLLQELSYHFIPGTLYAVLGQNGAGKTTFLKSLCRILKPTAGSIYWHNQELSLLNRQALSHVLSFVPQNPSLAFDYSVEEFLSMGRYGKSEKTDLIQQALQAVNGLSFLKRPLRSLSQGQRQRIYIARALVTEAPILLFDEPTAHLDIKHQREIWKLLKELGTQGKLVIIATHDLISAVHFCEEAILLEQGRCIDAGMSAQVFNSQYFKTVFDCVLSSDRTQLLIS